MMKCLVSCVLALACSLPLAAQVTRYALEAAPVTNVATLANRYQLQLVSLWTAEKQQHAALSASAPLPAATVKAIRGESGVIEFEIDVPLRAAEAAGGSGAAAAPEPLSAALAVPGTRAYYGATVRAAYVEQPTTALLQLSSALAQFGTGTAIVAIIDTGVDPQHPALRDVLLPGYDFTRNLAGASELKDLDASTVAILDASTVAILDGKTQPKMLNASTVAILDASTVAILDGSQLPAAFGHGTMVAGLVHLVAPTARLLPLKAFRGDGSADLSNIVRAIYFAVDAGAKVISMSFSLTTPVPSLQAAIDYAKAHKVICVASAGNEGRDRKVYPAAYSPAIGVGSTNFSDSRSGFSNFGGSVFTSAPGEAVVTTYPGNNYAAVWGTSFSSALVSGGVALLDQVAPRLGPDQVRDALSQGARVSLGMGDARLLLPAVLQAAAKH